MWNHLRPAPARQTVLTRCAAVLILALTAAQGAQAADGLPILFLGDQGHHEPSKRYGWIANHLLAAGFAPTYTENVDDLTGGKLDHYDALLVYANIGSASPALEKALVDYVESGHAFVPLHCASACFGNSKPLIALMGASFRSHMTGVFAPTIIDHEHPLMQGFNGYSTWDETYVHADHNPLGRTVLAVRKDPAGDEPWTWVRTQGKGRVFYTASGHDERTWCDPAFQDLIVRGTAWAIGDKAKPILDATVADAARRATRVPLVMEPRPTVQNYEKRTPYPEYQLPLAAKDSMDYIHTETGFDLQLFAGDPDIVRPIAFTWDHRGRLWVVETTDYPSVFTDRDQGHDRILICEDTNGDGKADKFTVFADHLNIPTGIVLVNGGVLVSQAPDFIFLKDTDGDDKADVRERVFTDMWSKGDTHAGPSNLHYGFDNHVYGSVGYAGFKGKVDGDALEFRMGIYRFSRTYGGMQFLGQYNNNTWGMGFNEAGELFGSTANNAHHFYTPIPQPYARGVVGMDDPAVLNSVKMDSHYTAHALTERIRQVDVMGGYTAAAGHNLYTARAFPQRYWNRAAFVNEPTMHLVHQGFLVRDGSGWTEGPDGINLLASEEQWVAPVFSEVGPDGALWVSDWYNFVVQHNPTPSPDHGGFAATNGAGGAHVNPLRDNQHGRIYRVVWRGAKPAPQLKLDPADGAQLAATLANDNLFWRLTAQRLLVERGKTDVVPALIALAKDQGMDQIGINGGAIHALWTLHGLHALSGDALAVAVAALKHPSAAVRRNAVQVLPPGAASAAAIVASGILADVDLNVRLAAFLAAADQPADAALGAALAAQTRRPEVQGDKYLPNALAIASAHHADGFLTAELKGGVTMPIADDDGTSGLNLSPSRGFEDVSDGKPLGWAPHTYGGKADFAIDQGRHGNAVRITAQDGADASWMTTIPVKPHTAYRLTGFIKTKSVAKATGALFNLNLNPAKSAAVTGTSDWKRVTMDFNSEQATTLEVNCLFGGWGQSTGIAWYDDVTITELAAGGPTGAIERMVARNFAHHGVLADQTALIGSLADADRGLAKAILDGLAAGWNERDLPTDLGAKEQGALAIAASRLPTVLQAPLGALTTRWAGGAASQPAVAHAAPLPVAEQQRFESGKARYMLLCVACHQPNGMGLAAVAPPLAKSEWVNGPESHLARFVLHGVKGPITAAGVSFTLEMPPWKDALDDTAIAEILTYVRHEWGNDAPPVQVATVTAIRAAEQARKMPWTVDEVKKVR